jgi:hypothetical protein
MSKPTIKDARNIRRIRDYAKLSLTGNTGGDSILSALVNLVDTVCEGGLVVRGTQKDRELAYVSFLCSHCTGNV